MGGTDLTSDREETRVTKGRSKSVSPRKREGGGVPFFHCNYKRNKRNDGGLVITVKKDTGREDGTSRMIDRYGRGGRVGVNSSELSN